MTKRRHLLVTLFSTAVLAAACGAASAPSPGPTQAPASGVPAATPTAAGGATAGPTTVAPTADATAASPTEAPTAAVSDAPATPAGTIDDLASAIPTEAGGITLTSETIDVDDFIGAYDAFPALLTALGKSPSDVSIIQAQGSNPEAGEIMFVQAFQVAGADATALMDAMLEFWKVENDVAEPITIGGKELIVQGHPDTDAQYKSYYYGVGDVIFRLGYNGDNFDEQMAALVSELP